MSDTIENAAEATGQIQLHVGAAIKILERSFNGRIVNGWGIYVDPPMKQADLLAALKELTAAKALLMQTRWPDATAYREAEGDQ
jgi:hypothetical protein